MSQPGFDVFLCHNSADKAAVKAIGERLQREGLKPWLDEWELPPGRPWMRELEGQISEIAAAAVFVGPDGFGPWQRVELDSLLREFVSRGCPVIPVILDGVTARPKLPVFLAGMTWVDFGKSDPDPLEHLIWGITGKKRARPPAPPAAAPLAPVPPRPAPVRESAKPPAIAPGPPGPSARAAPQRHPAANAQPGAAAKEQSDSKHKFVALAWLGLAAGGIALAIWGIGQWYEGRTAAPETVSLATKPAPRATSTELAVSPEPANPRAGDLWVTPAGIPFRFVPAGTYTIGSPESEPGRDGDEIRRDVRFSRGFWLAETETTQGQWMKLGLKDPSRFTACGENCPVEQVNWFDAVAFANQLSKAEGLEECYHLTGCTGALGGVTYRCAGATFVGLSCTGYRLPAEAEWEVAARAGTEAAIWTGGLTLKGDRHGPEVDPIAWYGGNSGVTYSGGYDCSSWSEKQFPSQRCGTQPVGLKQANPWDLRDMLGNVWE